MSFAMWSLIIGALMISMALAGTLLKRLPLSASMLYLAAGAGLGAAGLWPPMLGIGQHALALERVTTVALLISLFSVGLKLGLPLWGKPWNVPLRLALLSMTVTIALVAAIGFFAFGLPLGAALVLGGILAPTDPVLASEVQVDDPSDRDRLRVSLTGEGGLNDGAAFPFVLLGLGLLGFHELGVAGWRWLAVDLLWALGGGLLVGISLGTIVGKLVYYLRTSHNEAVGLDEFVSLGLIALAYGAAHAVHANGFLSVFAAGLALQRIRKRPPDTAEVSAGPAGLQNRDEHVAVATHPELAGAYMAQAARSLSEQLERIAELLIVLVVGFMLPYTRFDLPTMAFVAFLLVIVRPLSVWIGLYGATVASDQRLLISWFGMRGVGSLFYLMYVLNNGFSGSAADHVVTLTLTTITVSIVAHGISVTPLMKRYSDRQALRRARANENRQRRTR